MLQYSMVPSAFAEMSLGGMAPVLVTSIALMVTNVAVIGATVCI